MTLSEGREPRHPIGKVINVAYPSGAYYGATCFNVSYSGLMFRAKNNEVPFIAGDAIEVIIYDPEADLHVPLALQGTVMWSKPDDDRPSKTYNRFGVNLSSDLDAEKKKTWNSYVDRVLKEIDAMQTG